MPRARTTTRMATGNSPGSRAMTVRELRGFLRLRVKFPLPDPQRPAWMLLLGPPMAPRSAQALDSIPVNTGEAPTAAEPALALANSDRERTRPDTGAASNPEPRG